jgi:CII-binding regulator of phage lambda lysogenization HflD
MSNNLYEQQIEQKVESAPIKASITEFTETSSFQGMNNIKAIKIPDKFEEKEKLLNTLKNKVSNIDTQIKTLNSQRDEYMELLEILDKEISTREGKRIKNKFSIIHEELYSK